MAVVTTRKYEGFEGGTVGAPIATGNTSLDFVTQPALFATPARTGQLAAGAALVDADDILGTVGFTGWGVADMWLRLGINPLSGYEGPRYSGGVVGGFYINLEGLGKFPACGAVWLGDPDGWDMGDGVERPPGLYHLNLSISSGTQVTPIASPEQAVDWVGFSATTLDGILVTGIRYEVGGATILAPNYLNDTGLALEGWMASPIESGVSNGAASHVSAVIDDLSLSPIDPPVTRLYPRTDGRGLSSAPRHVGGVPRSRIVGGHP